MGMNRRQIREHIFRLLFDLNFHGDSQKEEQLALYFEQVLDEEIDNPPSFASDEERRYICQKAAQISAQAPQLDEKINEVSRGWETERMPKADLTILRLAVFEILSDQEIPSGVAINEAVELAKKYGDDSSPAFVNGVLARFV